MPKSVFLTLTQWFPTGVPRHTRVPQRGVRGAAKFWITGILLMFYYIKYRKIVIFNKLGVPRKLFLKPMGCREPKKVEKHCPNVCLYKGFHLSQKTFAWKMSTIKSLPNNVSWTQGSKLMRNINLMTSLNGECTF